MFQSHFTIIGSSYYIKKNITEINEKNVHLVGSFSQMYSVMHSSENIRFIKTKVTCNAGGPPYLQIQLSAVYRGPKINLENKRNNWFISFKTCAKREWAIKR